MTFLLPTVCLQRAYWHSVAPLWMKSVFLVHRLRVLSLWCQMLSSSPHSVPQPRSSSSTSSSSSTARRRPTSASWLTGTGGTGRRGTATAALKTRTGNQRLGAPTDVSLERCCAAVLLTINVIVFLCCVCVCLFLCEVSPAIKRTVILQSGPSPSSGRRRQRAVKFWMERLVSSLWAFMTYCIDAFMPVDEWKNTMLCMLVKYHPTLAVISLINTF